jgi:hypothetical protein
MEFNKEQTHCFFDMKGSVHREFIPPNTTVNTLLWSLETLEKTGDENNWNFGETTRSSIMTFLTTHP